MSIVQKVLGTSAKGEQILEYTVQNPDGASFSVINFGGTLTKLIVPDKNGNMVDVCIGFDDMDRYLAGKAASAGALIGRVGNRIGGASFELDGVTYPLGKNNGENNLHGGPVGFGLRFWEILPIEPSTILCRLTSEDGDQGFPGTMEIAASYTLDENNALTIHYHAITDKTTLCNLTNHAYFNLNGQGTVLNHVLQINAPHVTEVHEDLIPTGVLLPSESTVYGFSMPKVIGDVIARRKEDAVMDSAGGVDFNYCAGRDRETKTIATLYSPESGIVMDVVTDQPGVQCYTGQCFNAIGKNGAEYKPYAGVALETQHYPDAIHHPEFASVVLRPQDVYDSFTSYCFSIRED